MSEQQTFQKAVDHLRKLHADVRADRITAPDDAGIDDGPDVYARYQPVFSLGAISHLTAREFAGFLNFENNLHWTGLHRQGSNITADMPALRQGLMILLDETKPIGARYDDGLQRVNYMGQAIATAVLHVVYPDRYGVWNTVSEDGLRQLGQLPWVAPGSTQGERYARINETLLALAAAVGVDLWTLDALWYYLRYESGSAA